MAPDDLGQVARRICQDRGIRFVNPVGEGTFKQTFHVVDPSGHDLALKLYKAASFGKRDQREIEAMKRCRHKNIARLVTVHTHTYGGQQYVAIAEEFLSGGTLAARGRLGKEQCLEIGCQLVEALAYIAALGLVHRDIKPDNIMFRADNTTAVITDFGLVRDLTDTSITPTWAPRGPGTPFFAAPEQLNNEKELIDWRSDQFSLGIALAYQTVGDHPYRSGRMSDRDVVESVAARQHVADAFVATAKSIGLPTLPRMVAPWPVDRYRKPAQLADSWRSQKG